MGGCCGKKKVIKRTRLMNEDVLELILEYLSVKEMLRLERTSLQFMHCVNHVLKQKRG